MFDWIGKFAGFVVKSLLAALIIGFYLITFGVQICIYVATRSPERIGDALGHCTRAIGETLTKLWRI